MNKKNIIGHEEQHTKLTQTSARRRLCQCMLKTKLYAHNDVIERDFSNVARIDSLSTEQAVVGAAPREQLAGATTRGTGTATGSYVRDIRVVERKNA